MIKYIGSKRRLIGHIINVVRASDATSLFDGFTGTTRVAQAAKREGLYVINCGFHPTRKHVGFTPQFITRLATSSVPPERERTTNSYSLGEQSKKIGSIERHLSESQR